MTECFDPEIRDEVSELLKCLTERQSLVITLRYGLGGCGRHTLEEVGKELNITREVVRLHEAKALSHMRRWAKLLEVSPHLRNDPLMQRYYKD